MVTVQIYSAITFNSIVIDFKDVYAPDSVVRSDQILALRERILIEDSVGEPESVVLQSKCSIDASKERSKIMGEQQALFESYRLRNAKLNFQDPQICNPIRNPSHLPILNLVHSFGYNAKDLQNPSLENRMDRGQSGDSITLVAPIHISRLFILEDICRMWNGLPVAAAVYIPMHGETPLTHASLEDAMSEIRQLEENLALEPHENEILSKNKSKGPCKLSFDVFTENVCDLNGVSEPLNALKNRAMRLVKSEAVILTDGEHLLNSGFAHQLNKSPVRQKLINLAKSYPGVLIPSFIPANSWLSKVSHRLGQELAYTRFRNGIVELVRSEHLAGPEGWGMTTQEMRNAFNKWKYDAHGFNFTSLGHGANPITVVLTDRVSVFDETLRGVAWSASLHVRMLESAVEGNKSEDLSWPMYGEAWAIRMAPVGEEVIKSNERAERDTWNKIVRKQTPEAKFNQDHYYKWLETAHNRTYVPAVGMIETCLKIEPSANSF